MDADMNKYAVKILTFYASVGQQHRLLPTNQDEIDQLMIALARNMPFPIKFNTKKTAEGKNHEMGDKAAPGDNDEENYAAALAHEDFYDEQEVEHIHKKDKTVNANLESFKNLLSFRTMKSFLGYMTNQSMAVLDSRVFVNNRDNTLLQDIFNMAEIKPVKKLRFLTLDSVKHVVKLYIPTNTFHQVFRLRKSMPLWPKSEIGIVSAVPLSEILPEGLFTEDPVNIMIRMLVDKKLKNFEKKAEKYAEHYAKKLKALKKAGAPLPAHPPPESQLQKSELAQTNQKPSLYEGYESPERNPKQHLANHKPLTISTFSAEGPQDSRQSSENPPMPTPIVFKSMLEESNLSPTGTIYQGPQRKITFSPDSVTPEMKEYMTDCLTEAERKYFETIVIHIHGGGFVGMTSSSHQVYFRKWAIKLGLPVFSIEYRLAPQCKFPFLVNDCIRSYLWILTYLTEVLGCDVKKVIVAGDSAGGNLSFAIASWCIENGFRGPDVIHAHYPACAIDRWEFTPSLLYSLDDYLLHYNVLKGIIEMYLPKGLDTKNNYYVSPVRTPDHILSRFPIVEMYICERDPLRDNGLVMATKLL